MRPARHSHLVDKATQAAVAAIEVYNKPGFKYREETFAILMLNAWELILKARIMKENGNGLRSIQVWENRTTKDGGVSKRAVAKRNRAGNVMTIGVFTAANTVRTYTKQSIDSHLIENLTSLAEVRDNAVHFYNVGRDLHKLIHEIAAASLRNFAFAARHWFAVDLSEYQFALMPVAFETSTGAIQTIFADDTKGAAAKVVKLLARQQRKFPFDASKSYNVGVEIELRFVRKLGQDGMPVRLAHDDASAIPVTISEEDNLKNYPWSYRDLCAALRKHSTFKENELFHKVRKPLEVDSKFCCTRHLDPRNKRSQKQKFYNSNMVAEILKHYREP